MHASKRPNEVEKQFVFSLADFHLSAIYLLILSRAHLNEILLQNEYLSISLYLPLSIIYDRLFQSNFASVEYNVSLFS